MTKQLLVLLVCSLLSFVSFAQNGIELIKGGNMEDPAAWHFYYNVKDAKDTLGTIQFNYTADKPAAGTGGCYRVSTYGQSATFLWQKVKLFPGHKYRFNGAFKAANNTAKNTWLEFGILRNKPTGGEIVTTEFSYVFNLNTWMGADTLDVNTTFEKYFPFSGAKSNTFTLPDTTTDFEWFVVIKTGCWSDKIGDKATAFDFLFDNISLIDYTTENLVKGGNMEDPKAWKFYYNVKDAKDTLGTIKFNYTADKPAAGDGGCYRVSTFGQSATFLYQPITLKAGHKYTFSGAFKAANNTAKNTWLEFGIMKNEPTGGEIVTSEFSYVYNLNTWMGADTLDVNTTFEEYFPLGGGDAAKTITIPDSETDTEWFIVIKTGCWGDAVGDKATAFDFLFDNIGVYDLAQNAVKAGNMEDPTAWKFYYNVKDAKDTLGTIQFNYTADKPSAGKGGCYRVSTYGQSATFLYQPISINPGHKYKLTGAFKAANNTAKNTWLEFGIMRNQPGGGEVVTSEFSYVYNLNTWMGADTLDVNTTFQEYFPLGGANASKTIIIPDTTKDTDWFILIKTGCWGDAVGDKTTAFDFLFDEIELLDLGLFVDTEKPTKPSKVVASAKGADVTLTWDPSADNAAVGKYIIYNGKVVVAEVAALEKGNKYVIKGLADGTYEFSLVAKDNSGNLSEAEKSNKVEIKTQATGIENVKTVLSFWPNPVENILNIGSNDLINHVEVYNIAGQINRKLTTYNNSVQISFKELKSGVYLVKVLTGKGVSTHKIIKN